MTRALTDAELAARVRTTLVAVADAVADDRPHRPIQPETRAPRIRSPRRRRRPVAAAVGGLAALVLVAFANLPSGSEYVRELPPPNALSEGEIEGVRFWLVPSFHRDACGEPAQGVELVSAAANKVGMEWSTQGLAYGEQVEARPGCPRYEEERWLADSSRMAVSWMRLGADDDGPWGATLAVHPSAAGIVITGPELAQRIIHPLPREDAPDGPRYAAVGVPEDAELVTVTAVDAAGRELAAETRDLSQL